MQKFVVQLALKLAAAKEQPDQITTETENHLDTENRRRAVFLPQYWCPSYGFSAARAKRSILPPMIFRMSSSE